MTNTTSKILDLINQCPKADKETILLSLLSNLAVPSESFGVLQVPLEEGFLAVYFPQPKTVDPPPVTPEEQAEFQRRLDTIEDSISAEEMIELVCQDLRDAESKF